MPPAPNAAPHWLNSLDPRLKILLAGCFGVATWHVDNTTLGAYSFFLWLLCARADFFTRARWPMFRAYLAFILLWVFLKFILDSLPSMASIHLLPLPLLRQNAIEAALLGLRLCVLIGLGLVLTLTTSPRQLGLALSWFLRPILGKNSWKTALSLALMIHFLPLVQSTFAQVKQTIRLRQPKRSRWQRFLLVPQAALRLLAQKTWNQTVAVAARGLDSPEAWQPHFPPQPVNWILGFLVTGAGLLPLIM